MEAQDQLLCLTIEGEDGKGIAIRVSDDPGKVLIEIVDENEQTIASTLVNVRRLTELKRQFSRLSGGY